jgi:hypothetical protein
MAEPGPVFCRGLAGNAPASGGSAAFLAQNCPDDGLRQEVEKLLANYQQAGSFLSDPVLNRRIPRPGQIAEARAPEELPHFGPGPQQLSSTATSPDEDAMDGRQLVNHLLSRDALTLGNRRTV